MKDWDEDLQFRKCSVVQRNGFLNPPKVLERSFWTWRTRTLSTIGVWGTLGSPCIICKILIKRFIKCWLISYQVWWSMRTFFLVSFLISHQKSPWVPKLSVLKHQYFIHCILSLITIHIIFTSELKFAFFIILFLIVYLPQHFLSFTMCTLDECHLSVYNSMKLYIAVSALVGQIISYPRHSRRSTRAVFYNPLAIDRKKSLDEPNGFKISK